MRPDSKRASWTTGTAKHGVKRALKDAARRQMRQRGKRAVNQEGE